MPRRRGLRVEAPVRLGDSPDVIEMRVGRDDGHNSQAVTLCFLDQLVALLYRVDEKRIQGSPSDTR